MKTRSGWIHSRTNTLKYIELVEGSPVKLWKSARFRRALDELESDFSGSASDDSCVIVGVEPPTRQPVKRSLLAELTMPGLDTADSSVPGPRIKVEEATCNDFDQDVMIVDPMQPVFETPPTAYTAEKILRILLDPNINPDKICEFDSKLALMKEKWAGLDPQKDDRFY